MIKLNCILISLFLSSTFTLAQADEKHDTKESTTFLRISHDNTSPNYPRKLGNVTILCNYSSELIQIQLPQSAEYAQIKIISDNDIKWEGLITSEVPYTNLPPLPNGEYVVTCRTNQNQYFVGYIVF